MKGKLLILDQAESIGKILFEKGLESSLRRFPKSYETGDIIDVTFVGNDPGREIITMSAEAPELYYGSLMLPSKENWVRKSILVYYPRILGLLPYSELDFELNQKNQYVSFRIHKDENGRMSAHSIERVNEKDRYKCEPADFGKIRAYTKPVLDGFVKQVIKTVDVKYAIGKIDSKHYKQLDNGKVICYGFIKSPEYKKDICFNLDIFLKCYQKEPELYDKVKFKVRQYDDKYSVIEFYEEDAKEILAPEKQRIVIKCAGGEYELPLMEYVKLYGKEPNAGDLIKCTREGESISLIFSEDMNLSELSGYSFGYTDQDMPPEQKQGVISQYFPKREFGFVRPFAYDKQVFFHVSVYQNCFKKGTPELGDKVQFTISKNPDTQKMKVKRFFPISQFNCRDEHFVDFVFPDPSELYLAYMYEGEIQELRRVDLSQPSQAIAYYKSRRHQEQYLLEAVETMIRYGYKDKNTKREDLLSLRLELLNKLIEDAKRKNLPWLLSEYQYRLQSLEFSPQKLQNCDSSLALKLLEDVQIKLLARQREPWAVIESKAEIVELNHREKWDIMTDQTMPKAEPLAASESWEIDLKDYEVRLPVSRPETYYDIGL